MPPYLKLFRGMFYGLLVYTLDQLLSQITIKLFVMILFGILFSFVWDKLRVQAMTDPLSGLLNKRGIFKIAKRVLRDAKRRKQPFFVAIIDLDRFKEVNDYHGHLHGDRLLKKFSELLKRNLRKNDIAARFGGDEFLLLLRNVNLQQVEDITCRIKENAASELNIHFSCGFSSYPDNARDWETLFKKADEALYHAKNSPGISIYCC